MAKHTWEGRRLLKGLPCQLTVEHSVSVSVHFMNKFVHPCKNIVIKPRPSNVYNSQWRMEKVSQATCNGKYEDCIKQSDCCSGSKLISNTYL